MSKELTIHGEALGASQKGALAVEQFLKDNYLFRFNELSGKVEFVTLPAGENPDWRVLTEKALNSIILRAKREDVCEGANPKSDIQMLVNSDDVETFNPITWYLNLSNKFDKEMALTNNLIVNLDELDAIPLSQHAALKQTLSKSKVNGRRIYAASQEDRLRYASFVATTNNPHPLSDVTGSRRYICLTIPEGQYIDNTGDIDYDQLYAQVLYEIRELNSPYWFNNEQVARIQQLNLNYMDQKDIIEVVEVCIRKPKEGEQGVRMKSGEIVKLICREFPTIKDNHSTKIHLGKAMKELGYEGKTHNGSTYYRVIPLKAA